MDLVTMKADKDGLMIPNMRANKDVRHTSKFDDDLVLSERNIA